MTDDMQQPIDARTVDGDPHDRPQHFARVVDTARVERILRDARDPARPLPTADELHAAVQYDRAMQLGDERLCLAAAVLLDQALGRPAPAGHLHHLTRQVAQVTGPAPWTVPPPAPLAAADAALVLYLAACRECSQAGVNLGEDGKHMAVPFATEADRDRWAEQHALHRLHRVALVEQHPATGSTITGHVDGTPPVPAPGAPTGPARAVVPYEPPLIAFMVRSGKDPDLLCTIPNRAGAAWLLTAAHATMLGRGSLGIEQPHRILYVGRLSGGPAVDDPDTGEGRPPGLWEVRIDGMLGATGPGFGGPIGCQWGVSGTASVPDVEDAVEALITDEFGIDRHTFSVIVMTDAPVTDPPDPQAEAVLRAERLERREAHTTAGGTPVDAVREFVGLGPAAEVADTPPAR